MAPKLFFSNKHEHRITNCLPGWMQKSKPAEQQAKLSNYQFNSFQFHQKITQKLVILSFNKNMSTQAIYMDFSMKLWPYLTFTLLTL